jgi:hypothetical protein
VEIVPGIYRVDNVGGANSYLAVSEDTTLVIDTGMAVGKAKFSQGEFLPQLNNATRPKWYG